MTRKHLSNEVKKLTSATVKERVQILEYREDKPQIGKICQYKDIDDSDRKVARDIGATFDYVRYTRRMLCGYFPSEIADRERWESLKQAREEHKRNSPQFHMLAEMDFRNQMITEIRQDMERRFNELSMDFYHRVMAEIKGHLENEMNRKFAQLREPSEPEEKVIKLRRGLPKELKGGA